MSDNKYADRTTAEVTPEVPKNTLAAAVKTIQSNLRQNKLSDKHLTALYVCMGFSVGRTYDEKRVISGRTSPFWREEKGEAIITSLGLSLVDNQTRDSVPTSVINPLRVPYEDKARDFRLFCDRSTQIMARWLATDKRILEFLTNLVSREGTIALKRDDPTGSSLRFSMMGPIIGKWVVPEQFEKQRSVNFNKTQAKFAVLKGVVKFGTTLFGFATGATDSEKQAEFAVGLIEKGAEVTGLIGEQSATHPVWNNMRAFLVRSQDVTKILAQITDELLRQQRGNEIEIRHQKQQIRERLDRRENEEERREMRSSTESLGITLVNQILDVSCNISLGFYGIYKLYNSITGDTELSSKGQAAYNTEFDMDATGDRQLVAEFLDIVQDSIEANAIVQFLKNVGKKISPEWLDKVRSAFAAFEQDLRDGIQDVELALSSYRLRVSAENDLYNAVKSVNRIRLGKNMEKQITVGKLPTYDDVTNPLDILARPGDIRRKNEL